MRTASHASSSSREQAGQPTWEPASNLADEDGTVCAALLSWQAGEAAARLSLQGSPPYAEVPPQQPDGPPPLGMPPVVRALEGVGLQVYAGVFEDLGYDDLRYLLGMDAAERAQVAESVAMKRGHAEKFARWGFSIPIADA